MKSHIILGVDPGIKNTGLAIVRGDTGYKLTDHLHIKTDPKAILGERLSTIHAGLIDFLSRPGNNLVQAITIEKCFANKNVSSNSTTQQAIAMIHLVGHKLGLPVIEITPQKIKAATGMGGRATKEDMLRTATALFGKQFCKKDNHLVDAAFAAVCGILKSRQNGGIPSD